MGIELIKLIPMEIESINDSDIMEPVVELNSNEEKVIGEMHKYHRQLFTLYMDCQKQSEKLNVELKYVKTDEERIKMLHEAMKYASKHKTLKHLFWYCLEEDFRIWDMDIRASVLAVRKGNLVVLAPNRPRIMGFGPFQFGPMGEE